MNNLYKIFISLILILTTLISNAKKSDNNRNSIIKQESDLTFDLFSSLNTFSPRWRIGYIKDINTKWKIGLNLGYGNRNISYTYFANKFEKDFKLWELRPEIYRVFKRNEKTTRYISLELFYINHTDVIHDKYYYPKAGGEISFNQADYQRHKYGFNINVGQFIKIRNSFKINIFTGLGLKMRDVSFTNIVNPHPSETSVDMFDLYQYREKEGFAFGLNYSIGLKLLF